jgi:hypothetical protein
MAGDLKERLSTLDLDANDGPYGEWFFHLSDYVDRLQRAVAEDGNYPPITPGVYPARETAAALADAGSHCNPTKTFLEIESAIRMECFEFKEEWETETSES